ncbi:MAG: type II toxin-antitoxin system VapC family toxin [Candidatus Rokubacteria bacterium]|nr:type II toxin-antitoxin system VapC family toxin [Candidatus Rokubacteria bacterium]
MKRERPSSDDGMREDCQRGSTGESFNLDADWARYLVVEVTNSLIQEGARLAEAHRLRAYDAVHLASAAFVHRQLAERVVFASWDLNLEKVAKREGFELLRSGL